MGKRAGNKRSSNRSSEIRRGGVIAVDYETRLPANLDSWINRFSLSKGTPLLENIYDTIASEFSKIDLVLSMDEHKTKVHGSVEQTYIKLENDPNYDVLTLRPNALQTKSELLYTVAYQLHLYRNAIVRIVRDENSERNIVTALEPVNCEDYLFGQGYEIDNGYYLRLLEKKTGKALLLDYSDVIHLRLNPNDVFYGDRNDKFDLTSFVKIFDENLSVLLNELKDAGSVHGIIEIGSGAFGTGGFNSTLMGKDEKIDKQREIVDRIKATKDGGVVVLDGGEKWHSLGHSFRTASTEEVNNTMKYLFSFKGINQSVIDGTATAAQMEVFFNKTIAPILERFIEELNYKFLTKEDRTHGIRIEHFRNPFEYMSIGEMLSNLYLGAMYYTQNEVRRMALRLPPLKGGDELMDNKNFTKNLGRKIKQKDGGDKDDGAEDN